MVATAKKKEQPAGSGQMINMRQLLERVTLSRSTIYRRVRAKKFPAPRVISEGRLAWLLDDVLEWQKATQPAIVSPGRHRGMPQTRSGLRVR